MSLGGISRDLELSDSPLSKCGWLVVVGRRSHLLTLVDMSCGKSSCWVTPLHADTIDSDTANGTMSNAFMIQRCFQLHFKPHPYYV